MAYIYYIFSLFRDQEGATHTKVYVDPDAKNEKHEGVEYADLKFEHSQPKPPPPQSKKEVEMVTYAVVDNTKKDKPEYADDKYKLCL